ncbi:MAG: paraslipin [Alphaproteobacteria bacterium]|nr:paraslipin [Alphaproteobacteria bacterium]
MEFLFVIGFIVVILVMTVKQVPHQQVYIVERFGKFDRKMEPGLGFIVPFIERIAYKHSLKEMAMDVAEQTAITKDNVAVHMDGVIYLKILNAVDASYGVEDPVYAATQLAQTTMRAEIGKMTLEQTFEEREKLNANIVLAINHAAESWGIQCMRYEIKNITPPKTITLAMEKQVAADRQKRADILQSEGHRDAAINNAEGQKQEAVKRSEGAKIDQINRAEGEAQAILAVAEATAKGIELVAAAINQAGGSEAVSMKIAEQYVGAFEKLAKHSTTVLLPANANDIGGTVAQALTVFDQIRSTRVANQAVSPTHSGPWTEPPTRGSKA